MRRADPRAIRHVSARAAGARAVALSWQRPPGEYTDFEVQYLEAENQLRTLNTTDTNVTIDGLRPYTLYNFTVLVSIELLDLCSFYTIVHSSFAVLHGLNYINSNSLYVY